MATVRCIIQPGGRTPKEVGDRHPVYIRVSDRGKREYFVTGFYANSAEFDNTKDGGRYYQGKGYAKFEVFRKEYGVIKKYLNKEANDKLAGIEAIIKDIISDYEKDGVDWSLDQLRTAYKIKKTASTFVSFADEVIADYKQKGKYQRASITEDAIRTFRDFDKNFEKKSFRDIDKEYIQKYIDFYKEDGINYAGKSHKANRAGAISIRLREVRRLLNLAIKSKVGSSESYPFGKEGVEIPKPDKDDKARNKRKFIPTDGLTLLSNTDFDNYYQEVAKHLFLFSFHCRGINFRDMAELTTSNIHEETTTTGKVVNVIRYQRSKTGKQIEIIVTKNVQEQLDWFKANSPLIDNYLLPIILKEPTAEQRNEYIHQRRKRVNAKLKEIAGILGLPESQTVSIYGARHSFAMHLFSKGKPMELISAAMNHEKLETTQDYIKEFTSEQIAEQADTTL